MIYNVLWLLSQWYGSADPDPDPYQIVADPQHCKPPSMKEYQGWPFNFIYALFCFSEALRQLSHIQNFYDDLRFSLFLIFPVGRKETTQLIIIWVMKDSGYLFYEMIQLNLILQTMMWLQPFTPQPHRLFQPRGIIPRPPQPSTAVGSPFRPQPFPWIHWGSENCRKAGMALRSATFWTSPLAPLRPCSALFRWRSAGKIMSDLWTAPTRPSMNVSTEKTVLLQYYKLNFIP